MESQRSLKVEEGGRRVSQGAVNTEGQSDGM